jgi:hypothetical protein
MLYKYRFDNYIVKVLILFVSIIHCYRVDIGSSMKWILLLIHYLCNIDIDLIQKDAVQIVSILSCYRIHIILSIDTLISISIGKGSPSRLIYYHFDIILFCIDIIDIVSSIDILIDINTKRISRLIHYRYESISILYPVCTNISTPPPEASLSS